MWNKTFSILCPSRGRPDIFARMAESALCDDADCEILVFLDEDDRQVPNYSRDLIDYIIIDKVHSVGCAWNLLAKKAAGDFLIMGNDDLVFERDWDKKLIKIFKERMPEDNLFVAWCEDGTKRKESTFPIVSRPWYETLGYLTPEIFHFPKRSGSFQIS